MIKTIMDVEDVARYLGFSVKKIYRLVETNQIPASKVGRQYRFIKDVVDQWLKDNNVLTRPDWGKRLDAVLTRMRVRVPENVGTDDVSREISQARSQRRAGT
ncbi:MAG: helix-turn-helix domain-containing protein [Candidatus Omnitrophica bacterium]|nr:helix-turn-helix domain-containing protein [Candidatus Omnitrophota bacterium]MBI5023425.1 helix-turn-helix domain-containing protein [Candidatus Omnitrophota bacterium]